MPLSNAERAILDKANSLPKEKIDSLSSENKSLLKDLLLRFADETEPSEATAKQETSRGVAALEKIGAFEAPQEEPAKMVQKSVFEKPQHQAPLGPLEELREMIPVSPSRIEELGGGLRGSIHATLESIGTRDFQTDTVPAYLTKFFMDVGMLGVPMTVASTTGLVEQKVADGKNPTYGDVARDMVTGFPKAISDQVFTAEGWKRSPLDSALIVFTALHGGRAAFNKVKGAMPSRALAGFDATGNLKNAKAFLESVDPVQAKEAASDFLAKTYEKKVAGELVEAKPKTVIEAELPEHSKNIQSRISDDLTESGSLKDWLGEKYTQVVRQVYPLEKAVSGIKEQFGPGSVPSVSDPAKLARLSSGSGAMAESFMQHGPFRVTDTGMIERTGTPSLTEIWSPFKTKAQQESYKRYEIARQSLESETAGKKTGIDPKDAALELASADPLFEQQHRANVQYRQDLLNYWKDAGGVSDEAVTKMQDLWKEYVPLQRVFQEQKTYGTGRIGRVAQQIKSRLGSEKLIRNPLLSDIDNTARIIRASSIQRVGKAFVDLANSNPEIAKSLGMERLDIKQKAGRVLGGEAERLKNFASDRGISLTDQIAEEIAFAFTDKSLNMADDVVHVWRDGKRQQWRVAPEIATAIRSLGPQDLGLFASLLAPVRWSANMMKAGVTLDPVFWGIHNPFRDAIDATIQSKTGFKYGIDSFKGLYNSIKNSPSRQEWLAGGGGFATIRGVDKSGIKKISKTILPESKALKAVRTVTNPLQLLKEIARPFEEASRLGQYMRDRRSGINMIDSVLNSRDVTVDFQMIGSQMKGLSSITAFLNPGVQSLDRMIKTIGNKPGRVFTVGTAAITMPSIYLWIANRNDKEINEIRRSPGGSLYWFFREPMSGKVVKLPKPFVWGQLFGTSVESVLDQMLQDDPNAAERFAKGLEDTVTPNVMPVPMQIYMSAKSNKHSFFGTPIVPERFIAKNIDPAEQYTEKTSEIAKRLGSLINVSPMMLESSYRQAFGSLGGAALDAADTVVEKMSGKVTDKPERKFIEYPIIKRVFANYPNRNVYSINKFYEDAREAMGKAETVFHLMDSNPDSAEAKTIEYQYYMAVHPVYDAFKEEMSGIYSAIDAVSKSKEYTPKEKREITDDLLGKVINLADAANKAAAGIRKEIKEPEMFSAEGAK